jgi:hypothetical protein
VNTSRTLGESAGAARGTWQFESATGRFESMSERSRQETRMVYQLPYMILP